MNDASCKVLIVEDDPGISKFLRTTLNTNHYEVLWTDTGVKALEMISSHCPDCILLDLGLPDLDGTEVIRRVRSWTKTPIIVISALAGITPDLHEAAIVDGASLKQRIIHVDSPGVLPTFIVLLILRFGSLMSIGYEKVLLLQNDLNRAASEIISTYTYKIALQSMIPQYSYASAIGLFTSVVNLIMLVSVNGLTKKLSGSSLW